MRIIKTKWVARFVKRERISDSGLNEAIERPERGIINANLGGALIKQRVARSGPGTIRRVSHVRGLSNRGAGILPLCLCNELLAHGDSALDEAVRNGKLQEIENVEKA